MIQHELAIKLLYPLEEKVLNFVISQAFDFVFVFKLHVLKCWVLLMNLMVWMYWGLFWPFGLVLLFHGLYQLYKFSSFT